MKSSLRLETDFSYGKTNIKDIYFEAPYKIMSPFVQEDCTEVMQMCASAGMLSGDMFDLELKIGEHSNLLYTSQSYEKVSPVREKRPSREPGSGWKKKPGFCICLSLSFLLPTVILWEKMRFIWIPLLPFCTAIFSTADGWPWESGFR